MHIEIDIDIDIHTHRFIKRIRTQLFFGFSGFSATLCGILETQELFLKAYSTPEHWDSAGHVQFCEGVPLCILAPRIQICHFFIAPYNHSFGDTSCKLSKIYWQLWTLKSFSAGSNLVLERGFFRNSVFTSFITLGYQSGFINFPLQSLVNQCFSQTFERPFSKKERERKSPQG